MIVPKVSIIVPTRNEEKNIRNLLESIKKIDYPKNKLETIIVDENSVDNTLKIASNYHVKILKGNFGSIGNARKAGYKISSGDIIAFLDADMTLHREYIKNCVNFLEDNNMVACDHTEKLFNKNSMIARILHLRKSFSSHFKSSFTGPRCCRRSILEKIHFPEFSFYEDLLIGIEMRKMGYKIIRPKGVIEYHKEPQDIKEVWNTAKRTGKSIVKIYSTDKRLSIRLFLFPLFVVCNHFYFY